MLKIKKRILQIVIKCKKAGGSCKIYVKLAVCLSFYGVLMGLNLNGLYVDFTKIIQNHDC